MTRHKQGWARHVLGESERARESYRRDLARAGVGATPAKKRTKRAAKKRKRTKQAVKKRKRTKQAVKKQTKGTKQAAKKQSAPQATPPTNSSTALKLEPGRRRSPAWEKLFVLIDPEVKEKGPFLSLGEARDRAKRGLKDLGLKRLSKRALERGIKRYRPQWLKRT